MKTERKTMTVTMSSNSHPGSVDKMAKLNMSRTPILSAGQMASAKRELCGMEDCCCCVSAYDSNGDRLDLEPADGEGSQYVYERY